MAPDKYDKMAEDIVGDALHQSHLINDPVEVAKHFADPLSAIADSLEIAEFAMHVEEGVEKAPKLENKAHGFHIPEKVFQDDPTVSELTHYIADCIRELVAL